MEKKSLKFIDLFAGLGGFHKALRELGHECVFASENDSVLKEVYENNWGLMPEGEIRQIVDKHIESIPNHDILCAGFPCQPFSQAGKQLGRDDEDRGTLFDEIIKILEFRTPDFFILENVPFIAKHDNEKTWNEMEWKLREIGYDVDHHNYSPHHFGIPQHRIRIFIVGSRKGLKHFDFLEIDNQKTDLLDVNQFIEENPETFKELPKVNQECLRLWQEFLDCIPKENKIIGSPIWGMEFGATYPYEGIAPSKLTVKELGRYRGNFGCRLKGLTKNQQLENLPSYARVTKKFPEWKKKYIRESRDFYKENKNFVRHVVKEIAKFPLQSWQKLEWNVGESERTIANYILQFRASGIRVKKANFFPSLVSTNTQIPIIGWKNRYITLNEGLRLQSLEGLNLPSNENLAFKALGNAVNAKMVKIIAEKLVGEGTFELNQVQTGIEDFQNYQTIQTHPVATAF